jgi:putative nucleotidyltransferase with HDIG domain
MEPLKRFFAAPEFPDDPEKTIKARQVNVIVNWGTASLLVFALLEIFVRPPDMALAVGILILAAAIMYGIGRLSYRGYVRLACWLLPLLASVALNQSVISTGGVRAAGYAANVVMIILVGMLLGLQVALGYALLISVVGLGLIAADSNGLLHIAPGNTPVAIWAFLTFCFLFTVGILQLAIDRLRTSLNDEHRELAERHKTEKALRQAHEELLSAYDSTIEGLVSALHFRDMETEEHTQRVTDLAVQLARRLNIPEEEIVHIRHGALLHDIGKIGIPDNILQKAGPLTIEERKIIEKHTFYAYEMLHPILHLRAALDIPYRHHEKWDGSGYPGKLKGEQIPLAARLFSVVDVWDAISNPRVFRKTCMTVEEANQYLQNEAGKFFDPRIVASFLGMDLSPTLKEQTGA